MLSTVFFPFHSLYSSAPEFLFGSFLWFHTAGRAPGTYSHASLSPMGKIMGQESLTWYWSVPPWGKDDAGKVELFFLLSPKHQNSYFFFVPTVCFNFADRNLDFYKGSLSMSDCLRQWSPGVPRLWPRGARTTSWATLRSTAETGVTMPISQCMDEQQYSQVPWHIVLDPTALTKALLSMFGCQIIIEEGIQWWLSYSAVWLMSLLPWRFKWR